MLRRSSRKTSKASTRIGGPLRRKPKVQAEDPQRSAKAGILSGGGCKDSNRCSPYMFYQGEEMEYHEIGTSIPALPSIGKKGKVKKAQTPQPTSTTTQEDLGDGDKVADAEMSPETPRAALKEGWSSPPLRQRQASLPTLNGYDDAFTGGAVLTMIKDLRTKREKLRNRKFNDTFTMPIPENMVLLQQRLQAEVKNVDGDAPLIKRLDLVYLLTETYGFECDFVIETLCKELDKSNSGFIAYTQLVELLLKYIATDPHKAATTEACFRVLDVDRRGSINCRRIRNMKAAKKKDLYGTSGSNFAMIKSVLDLWTNAGDPNLTTTLTSKAFTIFFGVTETLVHGFLEEIVRQILIHEFHYPRERLLAYPDPPLLHECLSGQVSNYNKAVLSAIPEAALFIPGLPFVPRNTGAEI